jgi:hypothetical protein
MTSNRTFIPAALLLAALSFQTKASTFAFDFSGSGVSGRITVTYGTATDTKVTSGYELNGITGTFSDSNRGLNIVNASITGLEAISPTSPDATNFLAPADFSRFTANDLDSVGDMPPAPGAPAPTSLSYDNLFYPGVSPGVATDYPFGGGFLDIYGLLFTLNNGDVVNLWSNGVPPGGSLSYGAAVVNGSNHQALDYVSDGVQASPEPGSLVLIAGGLLGLLAWRKRAGPALRGL